MPKSIDERIVEMQFKNQEFEKGIGTSLKSIDKLKNGLNFDKATNSLAGLEKAAGRVSLSGVSDAIDSINAKFSAMGAIGFTVLQNLTNSALTLGKNMVSALTIDPVKTGFSEYETKMNAIRTILANTSGKGSTLDDVNSALAELNEYADKTIYNFAQMTDMVAKFAASTGELDSSVSIVKGLSNLAAYSGVDNGRLQSALYQVSQVGRGDYFQKIDWNSLENSGMATKKFKDDLVEMGKKMGVFNGLEDTLEGLTNGTTNFGKTLEKGWLTSDVFSAVTAMYALDEEMTKTAGELTTFTKLFDVMKESVQSGWAITWEKIIGDKDQATKFFTSISNGFNNLIKPSTDARNSILEFWNVNGGRTAVIKSLENTFEYLLSILKPIGKAFKEIFPAVTGEQLIHFSMQLLVLTEKFKIAATTSDNLRRTFKGLFAVLDITKQLFGGLISALGSVIKFMFPVATSFLSFTGTIGDFLVAIDNALKSSNAFTNVMKKFGSVLLPLVNGLRLAMVAFFNALASVASIDLSGFDEFSEKVNITIRPFELLSELAKNLGHIFYNLATVIGGAFAALREFILGSLTVVNFNALYDAINSGLFAAILYAIKKFIDSLSSLTKKAGGILGSISGTLNGVTDSLKALQANLKAGTLMKIAIALGILAAALLVLSNIDSKRLTSSLAAITGLFLELFGSMAAFELISGTAGFLAIMKLTAGMIALSIAVLILAAAMKTLSSLDWKQVATGLAGIAGMAGVLILAARMMSASSGPLIRASVSLVIFAAAMNVLVTAVERLSKLKSGQLAQGLIGIGVLLAGLVWFMKSSSLNAMGMVNAIGVLVFAGALTVLTDSVKKLGEIDPGKLIAGLTGIAIVLAEIVVFTRVMGNPAGLITTSAALVVLGGAIMLMSSAIIKMGTITWEQMSRGLLGMAGALTAVTLALTFMPANVFLKSIALLDVAGALVVLSSALTSMSKLTWEEIAKSLTVLTVSLGLIITMFGALKKSDLVDSTAFLIMTVGITLLTNSLKALGSMSLLQLGVAILGLASALAIIGVASVVLAPLIPAILALSGALTLFGLAVLATGAGVLMLATGLTALAAGGTAMSIALVAMITSAAGLIPFVLKSFAQGIIDFVNVLATGATQLTKGLTAILLALLRALANLIPSLMNIVVKLIDSLLTTIEKYLPSIMEKGIAVILTFLKAISEHIEDIVVLGIEIMIKFMEGVASKLPDLIDAAFNVMIAFITGLADAIEKNMPIVLGAIVKLMFAIPKGVLKVIGTIISEFFKIGANIITGMIDGVKSMIGAVVNVVGGVATSIIDTMKNVLGIHSPSTEGDWIGRMQMAGVDQGIRKGAPKVIESTKDAIESVIDSSVDSIEKGTPKVAAASEKMSTTAVAAGKSAFDKAVDWINDRKYYDMLSLKEELDAYVALQKQYKAGTEERTKADKEAYRVQKELRKADYDASIKWINDRKYYSELGLADELAAYKRVQARYLEGTSEREQADKEIYRVEKEIFAAGKEYSDRLAQIHKETADNRKSLEEDYYAKTKEINDKLVDDIKYVNDQYDEAVKSRADSLYSAFNLFDRANVGSVSGSQLISNLKSQVKAFDTWQTNLNSLASKGIDDALLEELTAMGPQSAAQIVALNKLSSDKLDEYVTLWRTKHSDAKEQATTELQSLRLDVVNEIEQLREDSETELTNLTVAWMENMMKVDADSKTQLAAIKTEYATKMGEIKTNVTTEAAATSMGVITSVQTMRTETEKEVSTLATNIQKIIGDVDWVAVGANIVQGMINGIRSKSTDLANEAARTASMAYTSAKKALDENSPSKKFMELGMYAVEGFVIGMSNLSTVVSSAKDIGGTAVNSLKGAISKVAESVSGNLDLAPTIRPILDLTDVEAGRSRLNSMFYGSNGLNVSGVARRVPSVMTGNSSAVDKVAEVLAEVAKAKADQNGSNVSFDGLFDGAVFNVRNDNDIKQIVKETAQEIYNREQSFSRGRGLKTT